MKVNEDKGNNLGQFLLQQCKQRGLSLRKVSINSGLSAATVHGIIHRKYQPTLFSLNRLADYLGLKREYLWQLAGLLEDMDYTETNFTDPQLRFHFGRADKLPKAARNLIISVIEAVISYLEAESSERKKYAEAGKNIHYIRE